MDSLKNVLVKTEPTQIIGTKQCAELISDFFEKIAALPPETLRAAGMIELSVVPQLSFRVDVKVTP